MLRLFFCIILVSLVGCVDGVREPVSTTRLTASGMWEGVQAELFSAPTRGGRVIGEILWPTKIQGGPPRLLILASGSSEGHTTLARKLTESGVATLRYLDRSAIDEESISAFVSALRRDPRVGQIEILSEDEARATLVAVHARR